MYYVLEFTYGEYSSFDTQIMGIFSSLGKCEEAMEWLIANDTLVQSNWRLDGHYRESSGRFNIFPLELDKINTKDHHYNFDFAISYWNGANGTESSKEEDAKHDSSN